MAETWGQMIRRSRDNLHLTQAQAASMAGVDVRTWKRWEAGACIPRQTETSAVIAALHLPRSIAWDARQTSLVSMQTNARN